MTISLFSIRKKKNIYDHAVLSVRETAEIKIFQEIAVLISAGFLKRSFRHPIRIEQTGNLLYDGLVRNREKCDGKTGS